MPELSEFQQIIIQKTAEHVKEKFEGEGSGHDWWHIYRVWKCAKEIAKGEKANLFIVELGALLHDIADHKFHGGDEEIGPKKAREWMEQLEIEEEHILHVCQIVKDISFKGAKVSTPMQSLEGEIVQDADRLDAIGAIGIGRAFAFGGSRNREMYNPAHKPTMHSSFEDYKKDNGATLNHFYEKLFLLKDRMNTETAKKMAERRHHFMEEFVERFLSEWEGK